MHSGAKQSFLETLGTAFRVSAPTPGRGRSALPGQPEVRLGAAGSAAQSCRKRSEGRPEVRRRETGSAAGEAGSAAGEAAAGGAREFRGVGGGRGGPALFSSHSRTGRRRRARAAMFFTCGPNEAMVVSGEWGNPPSPPPNGSGWRTGAPGLTPRRCFPPHPPRRVLPQPPRDGGGRTGVGGAVSAADPAVRAAGGRRRGGGRGQPDRAVPGRAVPCRVGSGRAVRAGLRRAEPCRVGPCRAEPCRAGSGRAAPSVGVSAVPGRAEPRRAGSDRAVPPNTCLIYRRRHRSRGAISRLQRGHRPARFDFISFY